MAASKIVILKQAVSEIAESCAFYNKKLPGLGDEFEEEIFQLFEFIRSNPCFSRLNLLTFAKSR